MQEQYKTETLANPIGSLITERDHNVIQQRLIGLERGLNELGELTHQLIDNLAPVRKIVPTAETELNAKDPEDYSSDLAVQIGNLTKQTMSIATKVKKTLGELEI